MGQTPSRPRPAKYRMLPPDATSLAAMFRAVHRQVLTKVAHLKNEPTDTVSRSALAILFDQRAAVWAKLFTLAPETALALAGECSLTIPKPEVPHEMVGSNSRS